MSQQETRSQDRDSQGCGCGGCGCGGGEGTASAPAAATLSIDPRLDIRALPQEGRRAMVLAAVDAVPAGQALVLVAPHAPEPMLDLVRQRHGGQFAVEWLQSGPDVWQVRLERALA